MADDLLIITSISDDMHSDHKRMLRGGLNDFFVDVVGVKKLGIIGT